MLWSNTWQMHVVSMPSKRDTISRLETAVFITKSTGRHLLPPIELRRPLKSLLGVVLILFGTYDVKRSVNIPGQ